jgi:hypothetical protein
MEEKNHASRFKKNKLLGLFSFGVEEIFKQRKKQIDSLTPPFMMHATDIQVRSW